MSTSLLISPITISFCRRKSTRVTAVLGGLVTSLGCLFASFAVQYHQLVLSYGVILGRWHVNGNKYYKNTACAGIGVGLTRDTATIMVGQYFKKKRELVEIFMVSGSGLGMSIMSLVLMNTMPKIGWRLGLQAVTGLVSTTFVLGK